MKFCKKCGQQIDDDALFCPKCGQKQEEADAYEAPKNDYYEQRDNSGASVSFPQVLALIKDDKYLALCILMSVSALTAFVNASVPIIQVLYAVFLWLIYADGKNNTTDPSHIRFLSGTVFASYVINWVGAAAVLLAGFSFTTLIAAINTAGGIGSLINVAEYDTEIISVFNMISSLSGTVVILLGVFSAAVIVVLNFFGRRIIHKFLKANYQCMQTENTVVLDSGIVYKWIFIIAIVSIVTDLPSLFTGLSAGLLSNLCFDAALILAAILIKTHMSAEQQ